MPHLSISLLGPFAVSRGNELVTAFESDKVRALLAYLAVESDRPHARETLAEFFWPDRPPGAARSNLRHALTVLRQAVGSAQPDSPHFIVSRSSIQFNPAADVCVDAIAFSKQVTEPLDGQEGLQALQQAVALVRGPFLDGLSGGDSAALDDWLFLKRDQYHAMWLQALKKVTTYAELRADYDLALRYARQQVEAAPWDETAYQQLMRLLALSNRRAEVPAVFETCSRRLADELAVEPAPETVALYERIQAGDFKPVLTELHRPRIRGYELGECIGAGHVGVVYRAHQPVVARDVAIKIILPQFAGRPNFIRRFEAEARVIARLEHPYIVPLYDFWREPEGAYLVMRWLSKGNLSTALAGGPWPAEPAACLVDQIGAALAEAHRQGIIHQDVKPTNILLDEAGNAYLSDFGIAKLTAAFDGGESHFEEDAASPSSTGSSSWGYLSPEAACGDAVTAATDVYSLGVVIFELLTGRHPFPDLSRQALVEKHVSTPLPQVRTLRPELPAAVDDVIQQATAKNPAARFSEPQHLAQALRAALGLHPPPTSTLFAGAETLTNPYRGLHAFQEADAPYFFGREATIEQLVQRMQETGEGSRFLAVVGPSGSGKSSLLKAGLLPALKAGAVDGSQNWYIVELLLGDQPRDDLAFGLLGIAAQSPPDLHAILANNRQGLLTAADAILPDDESELLLIIDQFETLFSSAVAPQSRDLLLDQLATAVSAPLSRVRVIIGLRADFYDRPLLNPDFSRLLGRRTTTVGPLSNEELTRAIARPAQKAGAELEPGLVDKIVADVREQSGALPMVQYTLTELFERRRGRWLQHEAYRALGGLSGALVQRAESVYADLSPEEQQIARQLFLRLVSLGEATPDASRTPPPALRRVFRSELETLQAPHKLSENGSTFSPAEEQPGRRAIANVIERFGAARLLTFNREPASREPVVEVAHEALLWEWPRLRAWLDESRDELLLQRLLAHAAQEWSLSGEDPSFLLRGKRLDQFEQWAKTTDLARSDLEQRFLDISLDRRAARRAEEAARRQHEAALERRSRNFVRILAGVLAVSTAVAVLLMLFAFSRQRQALEAYSLSLIVNAQQAMADRDTATALVLALAANEISDPPLEAQRTLLDVAYAPGARQRYDLAALFPGSTGPVISLALMPDGRTVLLGFADGLIILWDWESGAEIRRLDGHTAQVNAIAVSPDGRVALSGADDGRAILWDLQSGRRLHVMEGDSRPVKTVDISANGQLLLSGGYGGARFDDPGRLILWERATGREIRRFSGHSAGVLQARFALDDTAVLASSGDADLVTSMGTRAAPEELPVQIILWDTASAEMLREFASLEHDGYSLAVSPDGQRALVGSFYDNIASLLDLQTGEQLQVIEGHQDAVSALQFSADGRHALSGSRDGSLLLWDLSAGDIVVRSKVHQGHVSAVVMTPDGRSALSATHEGELIRWDLTDAADLGRYLGHGDMVYDVAYLPDGKRFVSVSGGPSPSVNTKDTSVRLWDVDTGKQLQMRDLGQEVVFQVAVTPDGKRVLVTGMDPAVLIVDANTLAEIGRMEGHQAWVPSLAISPDGRYAATGAVDGTLIIWDLTSQSMLHRIRAGSEYGQWSVAISPDSRTVLTYDQDGKPTLWELETGQKLISYDLEEVIDETGSTGFAFLPDGQSAVAQGRNGLVYQWDLQSGEVIRTLGRHNDIRTRMELTPAGDLALTSGMDGVLMFWNLQSGELIRRFGVPGQMIFDIDMSPDGLTALSGTSDHSIIRWRLTNPDPDELRDWIAANRLIRDLSCDERDIYQIEPLCPPERPPSS